MIRNDRNYDADLNWFEEIADKNGVLTIDRYKEEYEVNDPKPEDLFQEYSQLDKDAFIKSMEDIYGPYPENHGQIE